MTTDKESIIFNITPTRTRVAVINSDRKLKHYDEESQASQMEKNRIYNAEIRSLRPEIGAVFVHYDKSKKDGFLPFDNIASHYYQKKWDESNGKPDMTKLLKVGQKILVQVKKDQQGHESKGAALTTFLSLAGTYLVILTDNSKQAVSRKADLQQRDQVKEFINKLNAPEDIGIIIRTAGIHKSFEELEWDFKALLKQLELIKKASKESPTPSLIHEESNIILRNIRDNISMNTHRIIVNNQDTFQTIENYLKNTRPEFLDDAKLELYGHTKPIYEHYGIEDQVEEIFQTELKLPSGGSIVVHGTEAGYMIDVNSGKSTSGSNIDETALNTNLEAAVMITNILRLRDFGGIAVIDFIDMSNKEDQKKVENTFQKCIHSERAKIKFEPISNLTGCMLVLRQKLGVPFFDSSLSSNNHDNILIGKSRSIESYAGFILHIIENTALHDTDAIQVQVSVKVATYLLNEERSTLKGIEDKHNVNIKIIPNDNIKTHRYTLKRFRNADDTSQGEDTHGPKSYELLIEDSEDKPWLKSTKNRKQAATKHKKYQKNNPQYCNKEPGVLDRVWKSIFGSSTERSTEDDDISNLGNRKPAYKNQQRRQGQRNNTRQNSGSNQNSSTKEGTRKNYKNNSRNQKNDFSSNNKHSYNKSNNQAYKNSSQEHNGNYFDDGSYLREESENSNLDQYPNSSNDFNGNKRQGGQNRTKHNRSPHSKRRNYKKYQRNESNYNSNTNQNLNEKQPDNHANNAVGTLNDD